jgi:hypothetical protein
MHEEVNEKAINLVVSIARLTADELKKGTDKLISDLERQKAGKPSELKQGEQTLKQLNRHHAGRSSVELTDPNLRLLKHEMNKKSVDFAVEKDGKGKYLLYFKGNDTDAMTQAFKNYSRKMVKRSKGQSIDQTLTAAKEAAKKLNQSRNKAKSRDKGARGR